jgi:hypothetical protein
LKEIAEANTNARQDLLEELDQEFKNRYLKKYQLPTGKFI